MAIKSIVLILISFGGGITVGAASAAFITVLGVVPRLAQITDTRNKIKLYEKIIVVSFILSVLTYFFNYTLRLSKYIAIPIGLNYGIFTGLMSSALAEVLNVIPILSKKLKIKDSLKYAIWALMGGKVTGSLIYWLYLKQGR